MDTSSTYYGKIFSGKVRFYSLYNKYAIYTFTITATSTATNTITTKSITFTVECSSTGAPSVAETYPTNYNWVQYV